MKGLLGGPVDIKFALVSAYSSLLCSQFPPAWEGELSLLALMYAGIQSRVLTQGTEAGVATEPRWHSRSVCRVEVFPLL